MTPPPDRRAGLAWGSFIGDALAMPVHWYYDRAALRRDYGVVRTYQPPHNPHDGSILWRSTYTPVNERGDILHDQARYWGQRGIHYHQFLRAGENTLNLQLAGVLADSLVSRGEYQADDYLHRYLDFMLTPGRHRDTYVEECHRKFFTAYARGAALRSCAADDIHIGGLAPVGVLAAFFGTDVAAARAAVREHVGLTHRAPAVLAAADAMARIAGDVVDGGALRDAILEHGTDWISRRKVAHWSREPDDVVIGQRLSTACYIGDAFAASLYLAWKYADDFEAGLVANTNLGGDNCHRGAVAGALLGAATGRSRIPARFIEDLDESACRQTQIHRLIAFAPVPPAAPAPAAAARAAEKA
jgi:ADP-ribosyl-[dinitrogen reductase] hydrolase